ncbi:unnamed protein product [Rangifer tarandus platyrhynchus]|uniref:Uncharacterized protein n=2 Tax=Rangifer tarandus platyrhynchus TaxID=3082113 RepID=A0ACB0DRS1_RANTA|nr:unnamed protein product [Rangifer tarandus platyrhynchus]CAI9690931.1 unnamed protein product [Rangifer tarandus platyrhynchus]
MPRQPSARAQRRLPLPPAPLHCPSTPVAPTLKCGRAPSRQGPPPPPPPGARGGPARRAMKLQAVMETLLQRQQRARQELEAQQPPGRADGHPSRPAGRCRQPWPCAQSQLGGRAPGSEDEDAALEGAPGSPTPPGRGREAVSLPTGDGRFEDAGSDDDLKPKWEEEEEVLKEGLGDDEGDEEDEDYEHEEGLGPTGAASLGPAALFSHNAQLLQAFRGDSGSRALGGQEPPGTGPAVPGGAAHAAPQLQPPDHGDWT